MTGFHRRTFLPAVVPDVPQVSFPEVSEDLFRIAAGIASDLVYEWNTADDRLEWFGDIDRILGFEQGEFPKTGTDRRRESVV